MLYRIGKPSRGPEGPSANAAIGIGRRYAFFPALYGLDRHCLASQWAMAPEVDSAN